MVRDISRFTCGAKGTWEMGGSGRSGPPDSLHVETIEFASVRLETGPGGWPALWQGVATAWGPLRHNRDWPRLKTPG